MCWTRMPFTRAPAREERIRCKMAAAARFSSSALAMLTTTPPTSVLCAMSGERIFATTGYPSLTAWSGPVMTSDGAAGTPSAANTRQASCSFSRLADASADCAALRRTARGSGASMGARHSRQARMASAQASGVRKPATPASRSSAREASACGARKAASGLAASFAAMMGSTAISGWNWAELPTTASTRSQ